MGPLLLSMQVVFQRHVLHSACNIAYFLLLPHGCLYRVCADACVALVRSFRWVLLILYAVANLWQPCGS